MDEEAKPALPDSPEPIKDQGSSSPDGSASIVSASQITRQKLVTTLIICFCNLINFMDRYALPGILPLIKEDLNLTNFQSGLLQSAFVVSYVVVAPIVGYLGDRYSRKIIMAVGLLTWSLVSFGSSFMTTFTTLFIFRCFGGIGEGTYSAIGPAIIGDLFVGDIRSRFLALFYFTTLAGSGLGFIIGSGVATALGSWNWGLRIVPMISLVSVVLIVLFMKDPPRGESDGSHLTNTPFKKDVVYLLKNKSFMLSTAGSIGVVFTVGAIAVWGPTFVFYGQQLQDVANQTLDQISFTFGFVTIASGILGVVCGSFMGQKLRTKIPAADALICGVGLLCSVPFLYGVMLMALPGPLWTVYLLCFFGLWFINLNWALVGDILLYVVIPTRRTTAESFQILTCHVLGDATSPFVIGLISDSIRPTIESDSEIYQNFKSLEYALFVVLFIEVLGGLFFLANSWYLVGDRQKAQRAIAAGMPDQTVLYEKSKPAQVQVFVASNGGTASPASAEPLLLVKRSSTVSLQLDDVNLNASS